MNEKRGDSRPFDYVYQKVVYFTESMYSMSSTSLVE